MLPSVAPAAARRARSDGSVLAVPWFLSSYLAVWTLVGIGVYAVYEPHGTAIAGALAIAAGIYELTPLTRRFRRRCHDRVLSGYQYGLSCLASSGGLMAIFVAVGVRSVTWMLIVAVAVLAQRLVPPISAVDAALGLAIVGFGILIVFAPRWVPGLASLM